MLKKIWKFIWHDDSILSWIVNIVLAFLIVKFLVYPGLGLILGGTSHPIVAVVSGSMEHNGLGFEQWWAENSEEYEIYNIMESQANEWVLKNGFNKGDIVFLRKTYNILIGN